MNNAVFGKNMENVRKHRDTKLVTTERRMNHLVSEPYYHTTKFSTENLLAIEMKKPEILMNKPICFGLSMLKLSKTLMYEFWYDYVKLKYGEKGKLCYMDTESFIVWIKINDIYKDIAEDVQAKFDTSNHELDRPLPEGKNKKVIRLMKDELGRKFMTKFVGLRTKTYSYLIGYSSEGKTVKDTRIYVIKGKLKFQNYKNCLERTQLNNKINHLEKKWI